LEVAVAKRFIVVVVGLIVCVHLIALGQSQPSIQGVWRRVELTSTNPNPTPDQFPKGTHTNVQPAILIFTAKHFSVQIDQGVKARPSLKDPLKATSEELRSAWGPFASNAVTYVVSGSTLTMRQIVAKNSANQGKTVTRATIKVERDTLWMTLIDNAAGKVPYPNTNKYTRLE
jgi:hypothetical protein